MENTPNSEFATYDYMELNAEATKLSFLIDSYKCFGWKIDENMSLYQENQGIYAGGTHVRTSEQHDRTFVRMKRDRKIVNKAELTRLQRNFESCVDEIVKMEKALTGRAQMAALSLGMSGTVFMALSMFAVTAVPPHIVLTVLYALPGIVGWIFPYFVYKKVAAVQRERLVPLIEQKKEELDALCEKGSRLAGNHQR